MKIFPPVLWLYDGCMVSSSVAVVFTWDVGYLDGDDERYKVASLQVL